MPSGTLGFFTLDDFDLAGKRVFVRIDVNSPMNPETGDILGFQRFLSHVETIRSLENSKVVLLAHQSRPGKNDFSSLRMHARHLERFVGRKVEFVDQLFGEEVDKRVSEMEAGDVILLENTRFYSEEIDIDGADIDTMEQSNIVRRLSRIMDYYVMDAFPAIHRPHTSLVGFRRVKPNIAGKLVEKEIRALQIFRSGNGHPKLAILAGAKITESINVARSFLERSVVDRILVGGVVANAFLWASGMNIGKRNEDFIRKNNRNHEKLLDACKALLKKYSSKIMMPTDFILNPSEKRIEKGQKIPDNQVIADIGLDTIVNFSSEIEKSSAIFLNGPLGMYELEQYSEGTKEVFKAVASSDVHTIAGGGHTLSALGKLGLLTRISHASTGGGALISYLSGEKMPVLEALRESMEIFGS